MVPESLYETLAALAGVATLAGRKLDCGLQRPAAAPF